MNAQMEHTQEQSPAVLQPKKELSNGGTATIVDNRPETVYQRQLQETMRAHAASKALPIQRRADLPNNLKSGIENLSGYAMDDVKVHYNSGKPAQLQAHAYAQGTDIHLAPGQEKHLPHEAWHVVQQKQGRVKPTMQLKEKVNVNDDAGLEREADVMGKKAKTVGKMLVGADHTADGGNSSGSLQSNHSNQPAIQGVFFDNNRNGYYSHILRNQAIDENNGVITVTANEGLGGGHSVIYTEHMDVLDDISRVTTKIDLILDTQKRKKSSKLYSSAATGATSSEQGHGSANIEVRVKRVETTEDYDKREYYLEGLTEAPHHRSWVKTRGQIDNAITRAEEYQNTVNNNYKYKLLGRGSGAINCSKFAGDILAAAGVEDIKLKSRILGIYKPIYLTKGDDVFDPTLNPVRQEGEEEGPYLGGFESFADTESGTNSYLDDLDEF